MLLFILMASTYRWTLLLHFCNAFNNVDRGAMFAGFRRRIPSLSAWMDRLGPVGFSTLLSNASGLRPWYLDDGTLMGSHRDLAAALHIIEEDGLSMGW